MAITTQLIGTLGGLQWKQFGYINSTDYIYSLYDVYRVPANCAGAVAVVEKADGSLQYQWLPTGKTTALYRGETLVKVLEIES